MPPDRDIASIADMRNAAIAVLEFTRDQSYEQYLANRLVRSAVERQIEIIGEAARRISAEFKLAHPEIPWKPITAQRHILAHDYDVVRHERIWRVVTVHIPALIEPLDRILPPLPPENPA